MSTAPQTATSKMSNETLAGLVLAAAALAGLLFENISSLAPIYDQFLGTYLTVAIGEAAISKPLLLWINDGLMAVFFLFVAVEIKKEIVKGALSDWQRAALPAITLVMISIVPVIVMIRRSRRYK